MGYKPRALHNSLLLLSHDVRPRGDLERGYGHQVDVVRAVSEAADRAPIDGANARQPLREQDPGLLPLSGVQGPQVIAVDRRQYEVTSWFCLASEYCDDTSRHVLIEVKYGGRTFFSAEPVLTQLR